MLRVSTLSCLNISEGKHGHKDFFAGKFTVIILHQHLKTVCGYIQYKCSLDVLKLICRTQWCFMIRNLATPVSKVSADPAHQRPSQMMDGMHVDGRIFKLTRNIITVALI